MAQQSEQIAADVLPMLIEVDCGNSDTVSMKRESNIKGTSGQWIDQHAFGGVDRGRCLKVLQV